MIKAKVSASQKKPRAFNPKEYLLDEHLIAEAIWESLKDNDPHGVIEILEAHFHAKNTRYIAFKSKNPTLHTLAKIVHAIT